MCGHAGVWWQRNLLQLGSSWDVACGGDGDAWHPGVDQGGHQAVTHLRGYLCIAGRAGCAMGCEALLAAAWCCVVGSWPAMASWWTPAAHLPHSISFGPLATACCMVHSSPAACSWWQPPRVCEVMRCVLWGRHTQQQWARRGRGARRFASLDSGLGPQQECPCAMGAACAARGSLAEAGGRRKAGEQSTLKRTSSGIRRVLAPLQSW